MSVGNSNKFSQGIFFCTFTCYDWLPLIEMTNTYQNIYDSFKKWKEKNCHILGYVIMPNHVHFLIYIGDIEQNIGKLVANAKRFLAYEIVEVLQQQNKFELLGNMMDAVPSTDWEVQCYRVDWTGVPSSPPAILDARVFETNSEYDALNRVIRVTYPEDTDSERKIGIPTYNKAGALQSMEFDGDTYVNHIAYNAKGQRILIAYGNTQMTRYCYDNLTFCLQRLRTEKYDQTGWTFDPDSNLRQDYAYFYDLVGNIVQMNDRSPDCGIVGSVLGDQKLNRSFDYDPLYRLLTADGRENIPSSNYPWWDDAYRSDDYTTTSGYTQNYTYDKIGNMLELAHTAASSPDNFTRTFDYNTTNNFLTGITVGASIGTYTYDYDEVGNQIKENTTRNYEWDHSNNMRCFFTQAGTSEPTIYAQYLYSGSQRVKKIVRTSGGGYESTSYIGGIYEYKTDGTDEQNLLHVQSIARIRTGDTMGDISPAIKFNLEDHLGSSMTLLDDTGDWVNREEYYPFGETSFGSYALKRYRFQGKEKDTESGLYYFGARYYCAANCRFISVDAVVQPSLSSYCGMNNNPVKMVDLDGNVSVGVDPPTTNALTSSGGTAASRIPRSNSSKADNKTKADTHTEGSFNKSQGSGANTGGGQTLAGPSSNNSSTNSNSSVNVTTGTYTVTSTYVTPGLSTSSVNPMYHSNTDQNLVTSSEGGGEKATITTTTTNTSTVPNPSPNTDNSVNQDPNLLMVNLTPWALPALLEMFLAGCVFVGAGSVLIHNISELDFSTSNGGTNSNFSNYPLLNNPPTWVTTPTSPIAVTADWNDTYVPSLITIPFVGHANRLLNTNPHMIYEFNYVPPIGESPTLKYGITDVYRYGNNRPDSQKTGLNNQYGPGVGWHPVTYAPNRAIALEIEAVLVFAHISVWGYKPIAQTRP